jgi:hypothetical protein
MLFSCVSRGCCSTPPLSGGQQRGSLPQEMERRRWSSHEDRGAIAPHSGLDQHHLLLAIDSPHMIFAKDCDYLATNLSLSYGLAQIRTLWLVQRWIFASQTCEDCLSIIELFMFANPSFGPIPVVKALRLLARGVYLNAAPTPQTCKTAVS